ncbi:MAG TPA: PDZ domain-containing protein [Tepidisphaeraceae bacterium]
MNRSRCMGVFFVVLTWLWVGAPLSLGLEIHVAPGGSDSNPGTVEAPVATFAAAQKLARAKAGREAVEVVFKQGTYYLPDTLRFRTEDSGSAQFPVTYAAATGQAVVLSGGSKLELTWKPYKDGILEAQTPPGLQIDQLFANGVRQQMARYPNFDPKQPIFNGFAADAFSPVRAARWADPTGAYIHAMHVAHWGDYSYRITGKKPDNTVTYEGGWQNNRQMGMHRDHRYVENIFEELDAPGEWFHNAKTDTLYYFPAAGVDVSKATVEVVRLRHLIEFNGSQDKPVRFVNLRGFTFRHAARTFMDTKEPLLRSDWTIYRGGAVLFAGAEDCALTECDFDQVGGNTIFVSNYNRRVAIRGCLIKDSGASGVCFVGDPAAVRNPLFEYNKRQSLADIDKTPGPKTDNYPADCLVEDCLITRTGRVEKQTAGVQISMAMGITIRHCSIYEMPRAGINISEGTWGGHVIEFCDVFDTVLETGDHGSFNSWGRDRYWQLKNSPVDEQPKLAMLDVVKPNILRNSRWRCDHGWDIDLDDGSSNYVIYNNLLLHGGLKLREGFARKAFNNVIVNNSLHPHVWFTNSGDSFTHNIVMGPYRPAGGMPRQKWGTEIDHNLFTTTDADRTRFAGNGCDANSAVGDAQFINPQIADYRVKESSPALKVGFENFPMDQFGVTSARLKAIARTPELPVSGKPEDRPAGARDSRVVAWMGAKVKNVVGLGEVSAAGLPGETGVLMVDVPADSAAARAGLHAGDVILKVNDTAVASVAELLRLAPPSKKFGLDVWRNQQHTQLGI